MKTDISCNLFYIYIQYLRNKEMCEYMYCDKWFLKFSIWAALWQNQQNDLYAQQRLRSAWASTPAWASTQSDQSWLSAWRKVGYLATHWAHSKLIRLGICPGWSESLLGAHAILLVLSYSVSFSNDTRNKCQGILSPKNWVTSAKGEKIDGHEISKFTELCAVLRNSSNVYHSH